MQWLSIQYNQNTFFRMKTAEFVDQTPFIQVDKSVFQVNEGNSKNVRRNEVWSEMQHSNCNRCRGNELESSAKVMPKSIFFTFGGSMHLPWRKKMHSEHLITCICYNKVLSCEVDHIFVISHVHRNRVKKTRTDQNKCRAAEKKNCHENNYDRNFGWCSVWLPGIFSEQWTVVCTLWFSLIDLFCCSRCCSLAVCHR